MDKTLLELIEDFRLEALIMLSLKGSVVKWYWNRLDIPLHSSREEEEDIRGLEKPEG